MEDHGSAAGAAPLTPEHSPVPAFEKDGRRARYTRLHAALIAACRARMMAGCMRPAMVQVTRDAKCSVRSGFQHFEDVAALHREALTDPSVRVAILKLVLGMDCFVYGVPEGWHDRVVEAAVFGRVA